MASVKPGRNDPCPCGSGKKYKKCCSDKPDAGPARPPWQPPPQAGAQVAPGHQEIGALVSLFNQQRYAEAERLARSMIRDFPHFGFGWKVLGAASNQMGRGADALASLRKAAELLPDDEEVQYNLGSTLHKLGRLDEAVASYRRALQARPGYAEAHCNLGNTLMELGQPADAEASLRRALQIRPDFTEAFNSLALLLNTQGDPATALSIVCHSLRLRETAEAKNLFVACAKDLQFTQQDADIRAYMVRALTEPWGRPSELAQAAAGLARLEPEIGECVARAVGAWPRRLAAQELFGANGLTALASDALLSALLDAMPVCDIEMERFLTLARHALLETALTEGEADAALNFYGALARQCFINEYVFACPAEEAGKAGELRDSLAAALESQAPVPALWPLAVAAYFPLHSIAPAARLTERSWPEEVAAVLRQQVSEPAQERQLRATIPRLTGIEDEVSLLVQNQYEEIPTALDQTRPAMQAKTIAAYLRQKFPLASFRHPDKSGRLDVLVAGCGTGSTPSARRNASGARRCWPST